MTPAAHIRDVRDVVSRFLSADARDCQYTASCSAAELTVLHAHQDLLLMVCAETLVDQVSSRDYSYSSASQLLYDLVRQVSAVYQQRADSFVLSEALLLSLQSVAQELEHCFNKPERKANTLSFAECERMLQEFDADASTDCRILMVLSWLTCQLAHWHDSGRVVPAQHARRVFADAEFDLCAVEFPEAQSHARKVALGLFGSPCLREDCQVELLRQCARERSVHRWCTRFMPNLILHWLRESAYFNCMCYDALHYQNHKDDCFAPTELDILYAEFNLRRLETGAYEFERLSSLDASQFALLRRIVVCDVTLFFFLHLLETAVRHWRSLRKTERAGAAQRISDLVIFLFELLLESELCELTICGHDSVCDVILLDTEEGTFFLNYLVLFEFASDVDRVRDSTVLLQNFALLFFTTASASPELSDLVALRKRLCDALAHTTTSQVFKRRKHLFSIDPTAFKCRSLHEWYTRMQASQATHCGLTYLATLLSFDAWLGTPVMRMRVDLAVSRLHAFGNADLHASSAGGQLDTEEVLSARSFLRKALDRHRRQLAVPGLDEALADHVDLAVTSVVHEFLRYEHVVNDLVTLLGAPVRQGAVPLRPVAKRPLDSSKWSDAYKNLFC